MKKLIYFFIICFAIFTPITYIVHGAGKEVYLDERIIHDPNKTWTVRFNDEVKEGTVKSSNIYIVDERGRTLPTKLSITGNGSAVSVTPETPYKENTLYYLVVRDNLKSISDIFLLERTYLPFKYSKKKTANNKEAISNKKEEKTSTQTKNPVTVQEKKESKLSIQAKKHAHFVEITVKVHNDIPVVKAGNDKFTYKGNNEFVLYKAGLNSGDKVRVQGLSLSGKVIETKEVTIP